jgi:hypothetical protein
MAITFPSSPTIGDTYTVGERVWVYDGSKWKVVTNLSSEIRNNYLKLLMEVPYGI